MKKRYKILLILIVLSVLALAIFFVVKSFFPQTKNEIKILETIENFEYNLDERDTALFKEEYNILKKELEKDEINYENYASSLAKLFIIDLYTINNKVNKYDVGGYEYVHPSIEENYIINISDTLYKYTALEDTSDLPEISEINVTNIENSTFNVSDVEYESFVVTIDAGYKKELGYETKSIITIIKEENKLYVVKLESGDDNEDIN